MPENELTVTSSQVGLKGGIRFTPEQIDKGLKALVLAKMKPKLASQRLAADGLVISASTLGDWRNKYASRLEQLGLQRDWVMQGQAEDFEGLTNELTTTAQKALEALAVRDDWEKMNIQSLGKFIQSLVTSAAISTDKARLLREMPTIITENRDLPSLLNALHKFSNVVKVNEDLIEAQAVEVKPAPANTGPLPDPALARDIPVQLPSGACSVCGGLWHRNGKCVACTPKRELPKAA